MIRFWEDDWLGIGTIRNLVQGPLSEEEMNLSVGDLIVNNSWNFHKISIELPDYISDRINTMTLSYHRDDLPFYPCVLSDKFYLSGMYYEMVKERRAQKGGEWVWKLDIPPKVHFFHMARMVG